MKRETPPTHVPELVVQLTTSALQALVAEAVTLALADHEPAARPALLTRDQLAQQLGCSPRSVSRLRELGLPHVQLLDSPRFVLADCLQWLASNSAHLAANGRTGLANCGQNATKSTGLQLKTTSDVNLDQVGRAG